MGLPESQTPAAVSILLWMPFVSDLSHRPFFPPHALYNEVISTNERPWSCMEAVRPSLIPWWSPHFYTITVTMHTIPKSDFRSYLCELHKSSFTITWDFHFRPFEFELKTSLRQYFLISEIDAFKTALKYVYFLYVVFTTYKVWICWCLWWNDNNLNNSEYLYFHAIFKPLLTCFLGFGQITEVVFD